MVEPLNNKTVYHKSPTEENTGSTRNLPETSISRPLTNAQAISDKTEENTGTETNRYGTESGIPDDAEQGDESREEEDKEESESVKDLKDIYSEHVRNNYHGYKKARLLDTSKHELKSLINDNQAIELKRKYGKHGKVVLDFSKGNDDAKIIVYDFHRHPSVDKRSRIPTHLKSLVHSLGDAGTNQDFVHRLHKERGNHKRRHKHGRRKKHRHQLSHGVESLGTLGESSMLNNSSKTPKQYSTFYKNVISANQTVPRMSNLKYGIQNATVTSLNKKSAKQSISKGTNESVLRMSMNMRKPSNHSGLQLSSTGFYKQPTKESNSTKRGMYLTQEDKQMGSLLRK